MFHFRTLKLLAVTLLASLVPIAAANADHYKFIVTFDNGLLAGNSYTGYFKTNMPPPGQFYPDAHAGGQLMSLSITIDGAKFLMQDDKDFPEMPRIGINSTNYTTVFDYDASYGSATSPNKWLWMYRRTEPENTVTFGSWIRGQRIVESTGFISEIVAIDPRKAPPEPQCGLCHSQPKR